MAKRLELPQRAGRKRTGGDALAALDDRLWNIDMRQEVSSSGTVALLVVAQTRNFAKDER